MIRGTQHLSKVGVETTELRSLIQQRMRQILVHSCIYYHHNDSVVSDEKWQQWANELVELLDKHPDLCKHLDPQGVFQGFDGSTGYHLPIYDPAINNKALFLLRNRDIKTLNHLQSTNSSGKIKRYKTTTTTNSPGGRNKTNIPRRNINMAKKAKWLTESTDAELLEIIEAGFEGDDKAATKAVKALAELQERTPDEDDELSVEDALLAVDSALEAVREAYQAELEAVGDDEEEPADEEEDDSDDDEEDLEAMTLKELRALAKEEGISGYRKMKKPELIDALSEGEEDEEEDDSDDDEEEYDDMTIKDLKAECRERGIRVKRGMGKEDLIEALEADDEE